MVLFQVLYDDNDDDDNDDEETELLRFSTTFCIMTLVIKTFKMKTLP